MAQKPSPYETNLLLRQYLRSLDPVILQQNIDRFWEHDFTEMSNWDISSAIYDVLMANKSFVIPAGMKTIPLGTQLMRVRHVPRDFVPTEQDCWAPPEDKARNNRLNRDGDPWLYTSFDLGCVFSEMPIPCEKIAMVMVYKVQDELKCSYPGFDEKSVDLTEEEFSRLRSATQFLYNLFSLEVNKGEEHLYKITQTLTTDLMDYPECVGVLYSSVQSPGHHVAIKGPHQHRVQMTSVKMMDSVTVQYSIDSERFETTFNLLKSYDENLIENTKYRS